LTGFTSIVTALPWKLEVVIIIIIGLFKKLIAANAELQVN
jgi:hypothetical protein